MTQVHALAVAMYPSRSRIASKPTSRGEMMQHIEQEDIEQQKIHGRPGELISCMAGIQTQFKSLESIERFQARNSRRNNFRPKLGRVVERRVDGSPSSSQDPSVVRSYVSGPHEKHANMWPVVNYTERINQNHNVQVAVSRGSYMKPRRMKFLFFMLALPTLCGVGARQARAQGGQTAKMRASLPNYDVLCTGILATDTTNLQTAITAAELAGSNNTNPGGMVVLNGNGKVCTIDGTLITIGTYRHSSPLIVAFQGQTKVTHGGFFIGKAGRDAGGGVRFIGLRGGNAVTSFGTSAAEIVEDHSLVPGYSFAVVEGSGVQGVSIEDLTIRGYNEDELPSGQVFPPPVIWFHAWWTANTNCGSPPCGSMQIAIKHVAVVNSVDAGHMGSAMIGFTNATNYPGGTADTPGSWSGSTTYHPGDEVMQGGVFYTSIVSGNLNHEPPNASYWSTNYISGFDAALENLSLAPDSNHPVFDNASIYFKDFGNVTIGGANSWLIYGGIEVEDSNNSDTGGYDFRNISTEILAANTAVFTFKGRVGVQGPTWIQNIQSSDDVHGGNFLIELKANKSGCYAAGLKWQNVVGDYAGTGVSKYIKQGAGCQYGPALSDLVYPEQYSSLSSPQTVRPLPGFGVHGEVRAQVNDLHRNNVPTNVRFQNLVSNYAVVSWKTEAYGIASITAGIADPYGAMNAGRLSVSSAPSGVAWLTPSGMNVTPAVGDVWIGMVAMRANNAAGLNGLSIGLSLAGSGVTTTGYFDSSANCHPATADKCDNREWEWFYRIMKVISANGAQHTLFFNTDLQSASPQVDLFSPILVKVPNGSGFSDTDIEDYARSLTSYPPSCSVGELCNSTGPVTVTVASGTSTLASGLVSPTSCAAVITASALGTTTKDAIRWNFASAPTTADALMSVQAYVAANKVNFLRCNPTAASQTGTALVINWMVTR